MNSKNQSISRLRVGGALAVAVLASIEISPLSAQERAPVTIEVSRCLELANPDERLACFEREAEAAVQRRPASASASAPAPSAEPVRQTAIPPPPTVEERRVGRREARAARADAERARTEVPQVTARVTELRETVPNSYLITLDNGQVWRQVRPSQYPLRPGHAVELYATRWGTSFRLTTADLSGYIQVERVR